MFAVEIMQPEVVEKLVALRDDIPKKDAKEVNYPHHGTRNHHQIIYVFEFLFCIGLPQCGRLLIPVRDMESEHCPVI